MNYRHDNIRKYVDTLIARDGNECAICGGKWEQVDHIRPKAAGGLNCPSNLQLLCKECHRKKTEEIDIPKIKSFLHELKDRSVVTRDYRYCVDWIPGGGISHLDILPNPFMTEMGFMLEYTKLNLQSKPVEFPKFEERFCRIAVKGKEFKDWNVRGNTIRFKHGLREVMPLTVKWGTMCDRAIVNPAYLFSVQLHPIIHEKVKTDF